MDLETRARVCLLSWAKWIEFLPKGRWQILSRFFCGELMNSMLIWASKRSFATALIQAAPFYSEVLRVWQECHNAPPRGEEGIRNTILWHNPRIPDLSETRSRLRWCRWIEAGILTMGQLCHPTEDRLMGQQEIDNAYQIRPSFLEALAIGNYISLQWRKALTKNFTAS